MSVSLALKCPSCGSNLQMSDFDLSQGMVKCSYCSALMSLPEREGNASGQTVPKLLVAMPRGISLEQTVGGVEVRRRWFTPAVIFLTFFCIVWNSFLIMWYATAFRSNGPLIAKIFPLGHVALGVFIIYVTAAFYLNTTRVSVNRGQLRVAHGPLPWRGNRSLHVDEVNQLFCKEIFKGDESDVRTTYEIWVTLTTGYTAKLLTDLEEREQALFIEQEIERHLNIKDRYVPGEALR